MSCWVCWVCCTVHSDRLSHSVFRYFPRIFKAILIRMPNNSYSSSLILFFSFSPPSVYQTHWLWSYWNAWSSCWSSCKRSSIMCLVMWCDEERNVETTKDTVLFVLFCLFFFSFLFLSTESLTDTWRNTATVLHPVTSEVVEQWWTLLKNVVSLFPNSVSWFCRFVDPTLGGNDLAFSPRERNGPFDWAGSWCKPV